MKKLLRFLVVSLVITIMVIASTGTVFAANPNSGDCPNPDCPNTECPNPDCPSDGSGPMYQYGQGI